MGIKFDDDLNKRILRDVKNFNAKVRYNKTKTRGRGMLPYTLSTKGIKDKYSDKTRAELERQLRLYESFGQREALNKVSENSRISSWELNFFRENRQKTLDFYNKEIEDLQNLIGDKPEYYLKQHSRLQTLIDKREFLNNPIESLSEDNIKIMRSVYNYAERSDLVKRQGFRTYLAQLERLLTIRKVKKEQREELLNKFNVLTENEFTEMVRNEDIIDGIYTMVYSPDGRGKYELVGDDADADEVITKLYNNVDSLINKYHKSK